MCFSATASFVTSGALTGIGGVSLKLSRGKRLWLVSVPFIFALQQFCEGVIWSVDPASTTARVFGYIFLFFAYMWWPLFTPVVLYILEDHKRRKKLLSVFVVLGIFATAYALAVLVTQPLAIATVDHHIFYDINVPFPIAAAAFYAFIVVGAFLTSTERFFKFVGVLAAATAVVAWQIQMITFSSVWCFFAAWLSSLILFYFIQNRKKRL